MIYLLYYARQLIFNDIKELFDIRGLNEVHELRIESCVIDWLIDWLIEIKKWLIEIKAS